MAGMLPGVESARRRRMHLGGSTDSQTRSRRSSFCLYVAPGPEPHLCLNLLRRSVINGSHSGSGEMLGNVAREAKERLDEKLRSQRATEIKRGNSMGSGGHNGEPPVSVISGNVQREVYSKKVCMKFSWTKLGWKALEQKDCAVCLNEFKTGDILVHLPCSHRFHWNCAMPWLEASSHCPCCRMTVTS